MCASFVMYVIFLSVMYELTKVTKRLSGSQETEHGEVVEAYSR